jgi:glycolate oxidase FAD binding subunit
VAADRDCSLDLADRVSGAHASRMPLRIVGGDTKRFYGRAVEAQPLDVSGHAGIVSYDPAELVITARCGTPLAEVAAVLAAHGQALPFEPPSFGAAATIGGAVAAGLAGPARATAGPVRDYVLGTRLLTGDGRMLRFGGEVMKNVAGYDVSRLLAGSLGILGVMLEVSLKVLPQPPARRTLAFESNAAAALEEMTALARSNLPVSASAWSAGRLHVRIDGAERTLDAVARRLGGEVLPDGDSLWREIREQESHAHAGCASLWRLTVPAGSPLADLPGLRSIEWHGSQRWYADVPEDAARRAADAAGGFATWFRGAPAGSEVFAPLAGPVLRLHRELKKVFDPSGILNPGRMYADL